MFYLAQLNGVYKTFQDFHLNFTLEEIIFGNLCFVSMENMRFSINVFILHIKVYQTEYFNKV